MRRCGDAAMRRCGDAAMRRCGDAAMRRCGDAAMRRCGDAAIVGAKLASPAAAAAIAPQGDNAGMRPYGFNSNTPVSGIGTATRCDPCPRPLPRPGGTRVHPFGLHRMERGATRQGQRSKQGQCSASHVPTATVHDLDDRLCPTAGNRPIPVSRSVRRPGARPRRSHRRSVRRASGGSDHRSSRTGRRSGHLGSGRSGPGWR